MKGRDSTTFQNQENQENQDLRATEKVPSLPEQRPEDGNAASSEEGKINDKKKPLEKRSLCTDGFSKLGNSKRISATTPSKFVHKQTSGLPSFRLLVDRQWLTAAKLSHVGTRFLALGGILRLIFSL